MIRILELLSIFTCGVIVFVMLQIQIMAENIENDYWKPNGRNSLQSNFQTVEMKAATEVDHTLNLEMQDSFIFKNHHVISERKLQEDKIIFETKVELEDWNQLDQYLFQTVLEEFLFNMGMDVVVVVYTYTLTSQSTGVSTSQETGTSQGFRNLAAKSLFQGTSAAFDAADKIHFNDNYYEQMGKSSKTNRLLAEQSIGFEVIIPSTSSTDYDDVITALTDNKDDVAYLYYEKTDVNVTFDFVMVQLYATEEGSTDASSTGESSNSSLLPLIIGIVGGTVFFSTIVATIYYYACMKRQPQVAEKSEET